MLEKGADRDGDDHHEARRGAGRVSGDRARVRRAGRETSRRRARPEAEPGRLHVVGDRRRGGQGRPSDDGYGAGVRRRRRRHARLDDRDRGGREVRPRRRRDPRSEQQVHSHDPEGRNRRAEGALPAGDRGEPALPNRCRLHRAGARLELPDPPRRARRVVRDERCQAGRWLGDQRVQAVPLERQHVATAHRVRADHARRLLPARRDDVPRREGHEGLLGRRALRQAWRAAGEQRPLDAGERLCSPTKTVSAR